MIRPSTKWGLCLVLAVCFMTLPVHAPIHGNGSDVITNLKEQVKVAQEYRDILKGYQDKVKSGEYYLYQPRPYVYVLGEKAAVEIYYLHMYRLFGQEFAMQAYAELMKEVEALTKKNLMELERDIKRLDAKIKELKQKIADLEQAEEDEKLQDVPSGKVIAWRMMPGYPKQNPKKIRWSEKWKWLDVNINPGSILVHDLRRHGSTGEVTVDWTFNFTFSGYQKTPLKPGERFVLEIDGDLTIKKNEKLYGKGETVKAAWVGFELIDSNPKDVSTRLYELDGVTLGLKKRTGNRKMVFKVPEDTSQFTTLEMSIVLGGRGVAWLCKWQPDIKK